MEDVPLTPGIASSTQAYLREVLRRWLEGPNFPPIRDLVEALRVCGQQDEAEALEKQFGSM